MIWLALFVCVCGLMYDDSELKERIEKLERTLWAHGIYDDK